MTSKANFDVTDKAGVFVAGMRSPGAGKTMELTDEQAFYPLLIGELRRPEPDNQARSRAPKKPDTGPAGE